MWYHYKRTTILGHWKSGFFTCKNYKAKLPPHKKIITMLLLVAYVINSLELCMVLYNDVIFLIVASLLGWILGNMHSYIFILYIMILDMHGEVIILMRSNTSFLIRFLSLDFSLDTFFWKNLQHVLQNVHFVVYLHQ